MMYGSVEAAKRLIAAAGGSAFTADEEARLVALQKAVSALIEAETGRTFGGPATESVVLVPAASPSGLVALPWALVSVASVVADPAWDGEAWVGGTPLDEADYLPTWRMRNGAFFGLRLARAGWYAALLVTGVREGDGAGDVPDDITYAANLLMAEQFKREKASPAGVLGADGVSVIPLRNPLKDPVVASTLARWRVAEPVAV